MQRAVDSVIAQTFTGWELVIVNDTPRPMGASASPSSTRPGPTHPVVHHAENRVSRWRNSGYWLARGDFFCHLDPDDEWLPDKLQRQFDALRANPYAGVSFGRVLVGAGTPRYNWNVERPIRDAWVAVRDRCLTPAQSVVVRRSLVQLAGGNRNTPELRRHAQDWDQWIRTFCVAEGAILDEPVYRLYWHPDSLTAQAAKEHSAVIADQQCAELAQRIDRAREEMQRRPIRVVMLGQDAYQRGAQVMLENLVAHLPGEEFEVTIALQKLRGEYCARYPAIARLVAIDDTAPELLRNADVVHHHYYGWDCPHDIPALAGDRLVVTEHSAFCRYGGPGTVIRVWNTQRPQEPPSPDFTPPAIEITNPAELPAGSEGAADALNLPEGTLVLSLIPAQWYKGIDVTVDAMEAMWRQRPELAFAIVGVRPEIDESFAQADARIQALQGEGMRIAWHPPQSRRVIADLCRRAGVLLHLPRTEALGMVLLEAQACGCPWWSRPWMARGRRSTSERWWPRSMGRRRPMPPCACWGGECRRRHRT